MFIKYGSCRKRFRVGSTLCVYARFDESQRADEVLNLTWDKSATQEPEWVGGRRHTL